MTRQRNDPSGQTPFSQWIRALPPPLDSRNYDCQNLDYIWFSYRAGWFITLEEKRFGSSSTAAQRDTHAIIAQLLTAASGAVVETWRGKRRIAYRGHFILRFSQTTPDDSDWVEINGSRYSNPRDVVFRLLSTGVCDDDDAIPF